MTKRVLISMLFIVTFIGVLGCVKNDKMPEVSLTVEGEKINYITVKHTANDSPNNIFKLVFEKNDSAEIKYIKNCSVVFLDFGNNPPDKISIKDRLLWVNGDYLYPDKLTVEVPFTKENGKYSFIVQKNMASLLSSFYKENKTDFRGYNIITYWGENEYEHAFVIKADSY